MSRNTKLRQLQIMTPEEEMENLRNEVGVLRRTVESKTAAVAILRAELQECQRERDKFRTLAEDETLHRSSISSVSKKPSYSDPGRSAMLSGSEGTLAQLLSVSKEENKTLRLDCTELRCKLHDAQADIKVLREEMQRLRGTVNGRRQSHVVNASSQLAHQEREQFISQMESLSSKCQALEGDVRGLVEEREELVRELDASGHKIHRLNHILNTILTHTSSSDPQQKRIVDLDAIITENRYLQERLKQAEEEKTLFRSNALKYKTALEKCRTQGSLKLGTTENLIITPKQVGELLRDYKGEVGGEAETDLKSLCVALVDALNQRSRALRTQRSANKVLANRVSELERRLTGFANSDSAKCIENSSDGAASEPRVSSLGLMEGYIPPSGPIPKYCEEAVLEDERLTRLLNSTEVDKVLKEENIEPVGSKVNTREEENDSALKKDKNKNNYKLENSICNSIPKDNNVSKSDFNKTFDKEIITASGNLSKQKIEHRSATNSGTNRLKDNESHGNELHKNVSLNGNSNKRTSENQRSCVEEVRKESSMNHKKVSTYVNPEDELEEIVPIDQLDIYMKEVQKKRSLKTLVNKEGIRTSEDLKSVEEIPKDELKSLKEIPEEQVESIREFPKELLKSLKEMPEQVEILKEIPKEALKSVEGIPKEDIKNVEEIPKEMKRVQKIPKEIRIEEEIPIDDDIEESQMSIEDLCEGEKMLEKTTLQLETVDDDDNSSFDLDISDYDSDNDNLDLALQDWQKDCDKTFPAGKRDKPKKSKTVKQDKAYTKGKFKFFSKEVSHSQAEISPALKEFLDKATADVTDEGANFT